MGAQRDPRVKRAIATCRRTRPAVQWWYVRPPPAEVDAFGACAEAFMRRSHCRPGAEPASRSRVPHLHYLRRLAALRLAPALTVTSRELPVRQIASHTGSRRSSRRRAPAPKLVRRVNAARCAGR